MDCDCLIHPFQNDPGTSQSQRVMDNLLSGAAKIDSRTLADLLNYFVRMSRHINYYDLQLNINDWQPFFKKSPPFLLASIVNFPLQNTETNLILYKSAFDEKPTSAGLQLITFSIYYRFINSINEWHINLKDSSLPIASTLEGLIKNRLQAPVKQFIMYSNAAVQNYGISRIDFLSLYNNPVWGLDSAALTAIDTTFSAGTVSYRKRLINLYTGIYTLLTVFSDVVKTLAASAESNLEGSFTPLKEELQKKHPPHLALLFAFLNMFRQLQNDLNLYTRKHLDYFYKEILQFKEEDAIPDKAIIIFEIQKALKNYLIKKGIKVNGGKDENKQEILFSLEDEIVVNQTTIADKRTLFLNDQHAHAQTYVEGVYIAPVAEMADGVEKEFQDDPKNFPTLGAHYSKYINPESKFVKPYPNARIGFILASPVLSLQTGSTRLIHIDLPCTLLDSICGELGDSIVQGNKDCCDEGTQAPLSQKNPYPDFLRATRIFQFVKDHINRRYVYLSEDKFRFAIQKGFTKEFIGEIRVKFLTVKSAVKPCYCDTLQFYQEGSFFWSAWNNFINTLITDPIQRIILDEIFPKQKILNLSFSGEKDWIVPQADDYKLSIDTPVGNTFNIKIETTITPEKDSVVGYNKDNLGEDFGTTQPIVKVQLNDRIKVKWEITPDPDADTVDQSDCCQQTDQCCLLYEPPKSRNIISYYHFFRNVKINQINNSLPVIKVEVCGLKNFIVQNDESVMDVNGPVMAFGARPKVDSSFYIGSEEIFIKKWEEVYVNLNWTDKPTDFEKYYLAYQTHLLGNPPSNVVTNDGFKVQLSILQDGNWITWNHCKNSIPGFECKPMIADPKCELFQDFKPTGIQCIDSQKYSYQFSIIRDTDFLPALPFSVEKNEYTGINKMTADTRMGFLRITLKCQDFQHSIYPFILARQMMAFGKLPKDTVDGAVYYDQIGDPIVFSADDIKTDVSTTEILGTNVNLEVIGIEANTPSTGEFQNGDADIIRGILGSNLVGDASALNILVNKLNDEIKDIAKFTAVIPNEPWTPTISNISLDYKAIAKFQDCDLIHLYPYDNTHKDEQLSLQPSLFPTFCDEGTLFLGLKDLIPGESLNILFQMAEATSDSESDKETVSWHYLESNNWKPLRTGFEVIEDGTKNLTSTGIIKFSLPANMTNDNTIMPKDLHWIKATIPQNSGSVSETTAILPQAVEVIFTPDKVSDKLRLSSPLISGNISKLEEADSSVKSVTQPFDSFGGLVPEIEQQFYVRVSETLRHKGRAIQAFDYERLVLQAFPQLFKVKCVNHSFALNAHEYKNDFPYAGGYVLLAVIPDLNQLKAGNSFEPKVPVSIIEEINAFIRRKTSPFVRFRAMNPRYEKINFCLRIKLLKGKDENYFKEQAMTDIRTFLAPWAVGDYYKLTFGQCVYRSDIIQLLETSDYVDYISDLRIGKEGEDPDEKLPKICPDTPRSILIAGSIEVCIDSPECENWNKEYECKNQVLKCDSKPEIISDYCNPVKKQING